MGGFTGWVGGLKTTIEHGVDDSIKFVFGVFKSKPKYKDSDVDAVAAKVNKVCDDIEQMLAALLDSIPGVPTVAATMLANLVRSGLQLVIAGATQGAKDAND